MLGITAIAFGVIAPLSALVGVHSNEVVGWRIAAQPSLRAVWHALVIGADNQPPLDYLLRHLVFRLAGESPFTLRLVGVVAIWLSALLVADAFRRLHAGRALTWSAALLVLISVGFEASYLTRGYPLQVLAGSLAIWAWAQTSVPIWALTTALIVALYSHFYGVLHLAAVAIASALAWPSDRARARAGSIAILVAGVAAVPLLPIAMMASRFRDHFWSQPTGFALLELYPDLLTPPLLVLASIIVVVSVLPVSRAPARLRSLAEKSVLQLLAAFACTPVMLFVLARFVTHAIRTRYVLMAGLALAVLPIALLLREGLHTTRSRWVALVTTAFLVVPGYTSVAEVRAARARAGLVAQLNELVRDSDATVVVTEISLFLELSHDPRMHMANVWFPVDASSVANGEITLTGLQQVWPDLHAVPYDLLRAMDRVVCFCELSDPFVVRALRDGARVSVRSTATLQYALVEWRAVQRPSVD